MEFMISSITQGSLPPGAGTLKIELDYIGPGQDTNLEEVIEAWKNQQPVRIEPIKENK